VVESSGGLVQASALAVRGGQVLLAGANRIGTLAGSADGANDFTVSNEGSLNVGSVDGLPGVSASSGSIGLTMHSQMSSQMNILGRVSTGSGELRLVADNGGALTIA